MTQKLKDQLGKEPICLKEREGVRDSRSPKEKEQLQEFMAEQTSRRKEIDVDTEQRIATLKEKYKV
jgi:hypothetical protein